MKTSFPYILAAVFYSAVGLYSPVSAQDTHIDGKAYETIKKINLNTDAEFVRLKPKGGASNEESYIKVNTEYYKTSFTSSGLKNFIATGKLSSLGTVKKSKMTGKPITYIDNGASIVIVNHNKEEIGFIEIHDEKTILTARNSFAKAYDDNDPGGSTGDPLLDCGVGCLHTYIACGNSALCRSAYKKCWSDCKNKHQSQGGSGGNISYYILPLNNLLVKL